MIHLDFLFFLAKVGSMRWSKISHCTTEEVRDGDDH
jgi:hypothetical protein